ncbi:hypothetical protein CGRA01v4_11236 [Colletotrichum graminicola]|nr:hypothetical protein CGRA01v4_11236 [Colletotrichum graminicola]
MALARVVQVRQVVSGPYTVLSSTGCWYIRWGDRDSADGDGRHGVRVVFQGGRNERAAPPAPRGMIGFVLPNLLRFLPALSAGPSNFPPTPGYRYTQNRTATTARRESDQHLILGWMRC